MNKKGKMKFVVKFNEERWNGKRLSTGRQVKQKTIYVDDWDEAELVAHKIWAEEVRSACSMSLTPVR